MSIVEYAPKTHNHNKFVAILESVKNSPLLVVASDLHPAVDADLSSVERNKKRACHKNECGGSPLQLLKADSESSLEAASCNCSLAIVSVQRVHYSAACSLQYLEYPGKSNDLARGLQYGNVSRLDRVDHTIKTAHRGRQAASFFQ
eukprot:819773-Amphidinium_carterae.1